MNLNCIFFLFFFLCIYTLSSSTVSLNDTWRQRFACMFIQFVIQLSSILQSVQMISRVFNDSETFSKLNCPAVFKCISHVRWHIGGRNVVSDQLYRFTGNFPATVLQTAVHSPFKLVSELKEALSHWVPVCGSSPTSCLSVLCFTVNSDKIKPSKKIPLFHFWGQFAQNTPILWLRYRFQ